MGVLFAHGDHFLAGLDLADVGPAAADRGPQVLAGGGRYDPFGIWGEQVPKPVVMAAQGIAFTLRHLDAATSASFPAGDARDSDPRARSPARSLRPSERPPASYWFATSVSSANISGCLHGVQLTLVQRTGPRGDAPSGHAAAAPDRLGRDYCNGCARMWVARVGWDRE